MALWRQLTRGLRALAHSSAADGEIDDEVQQYIDEAAAAFIAQGLAPDAARRAARLEVGSSLRVREQVRGSGWEHVVDTALADLRYAVRRLFTDRAFAAVSIATLAIGIGATTAIFSAVKPVLIEPLPYPGAQRIVSLADHATDGGLVDVTFGTFHELLARSRSFETAAVMKVWRPTLTASGSAPERRDGQRVSAGCVRVLGVHPSLGRDFDEADDRVNGRDVAILSDGLWRRRFGADVSIVGRQILLDDRNYAIVGVMPPRFENVVDPSAQIWGLLQYDATLPTDGREWGHHLRMIGRLREETAVDAAWRELDRIARTPVPEFARVPWASLKAGPAVAPLQEEVTRGVRSALLAIVGAVVLLLAIACVNVANLLLARDSRRRGELALRAALGAGRMRLIRQLVTESLVLALVGGGIGVLVARAGVGALAAISPPGLPRVDAMGVDRRVLEFALGLTTVVGLLVGLVPAAHGSRDDLRVAIQQGSRQTFGGSRSTRRSLVVIEVALALVLLVGTGLLFRSVERLFAVSPGFDVSHVITMQVQTSGSRFNDDAVTRRFFDQALEAVRRVPGVEAAGFTSQLPLTGEFEQYGVQLESTADDDPREDHSVFVYAATPGYVDSMRIPLRRGRVLDEHDAAGRPVAVLVNESFAKRKFPGRDPIGQRVRVGQDVGQAGKPWSTIVGVVSDVKQMSLALNRADAVYVAPSQWYVTDRAMWLVVRARGDAVELTPALTRAIWSVDKDQPIVHIGTMEALVAGSAAERRFALMLFEGFAFVALALAAVGIYGILSGSVAERTREIGIRSALGASRRDILGLVIGHGIGMTTLGAALGLAVAAGTSRAIASLLFGVSRFDPITYGAALGLLAVVSALACSLPAWRAAAVDPAITLRTE